VKFSVKEYPVGSLLHAKFGLDWGWLFDSKVAANDHVFVLQQHGYIINNGRAEKLTRNMTS